MRVRVVFIALLPALLLFLIGATSCGPEVRIVEERIEVYDLTTPGAPIESGDEIGVRIPLENVGMTAAGFVAVLAQLVDENGLVIQQRSMTLATLRVGERPVFDFRPFATDAPALIDGDGEATFRISFNVGPAAPTVHDHRFAMVPRPTTDLAVLEHWAAEFVPFQYYSPSNCDSVFAGTVRLLAAVELYAIDPEHPLAISPAEAEAYVQHQADSELAHYYDPAAPNTWGPCRLQAPLPGPTTGVALLAYLLKVHGAAWDHETREAIRRAIHLPDWEYLGNLNVYNKSVPFPPMHLLFGEASCHAPSWQQGWDELSGMFLKHLSKGGFEANDRHYTTYHVANLGLLGFLDTPVMREMGRSLLDLKLLLSAHLYLPGGHIGSLNTRLSGFDPYFFPGGQRERDMGPVLSALAVGDDFVYADSPVEMLPATVPATVFALRQPLAPTIRRIFLVKGEGYEAWWLERTGKSKSRMPGTWSSLGEGGADAFAWQVNVLPRGEAEIASSYGAWNQSLGNKEGVAVRCPGCEQGFAFAYQWQDCAAGDTDDAGGSIGCPVVPTPQHGGYDAERMQVHRSRISLFDPRSRTSRYPPTPTLPVPRDYERSEAYLTNWDHPVVGGETIFPTAGGWYVGRVGNVFIAYRPLGDSIQVSQMNGARLDGGTNFAYATHFEMDGRSGGMTVLAEVGEFAGDTLSDFAAEMDARFWSFTSAGPNDGPVAELDYRGADGRLCRMKLEYMGWGGLPGKERRYIDCSAALGTGYQEQGESQFFSSLLDGQLMTSPFVSYDTSNDVLRVTVPSFPQLVYDWGGLRAAPWQQPDGCADRAYLEVGEPQEVTLGTTSADEVPSVQVSVDNSGFASTTVLVSFDGDDCTVGGAAPNAAWLEPSGAVVLPAGDSTEIDVGGSGAACDAGEYEGELILTTLQGNALPARVPVHLSVSP